MCINPYDITVTGEGTVKKVENISYGAISCHERHAPHLERIVPPIANSANIYIQYI